MKKICFIVAVPVSAQVFLRDHIAALSEEYDVYLAGNIKSSSDLKGLKLSGWKHIDIERGISLFKDIKALWQLICYFRKMSFLSIHSVTPKAGLLSAVAGWVTGITHRIHIFTGQVWCTSKGFKRSLLKSTDKLIVLLNNHILVDGNGQRQFLIREKVLSQKNSSVLGDGSICGVNLTRFCPNATMRAEVRKEVNVKENQIVYAFMGRLNHDKGLYELLPAFDKLAGDYTNVFLLLFGADEENVASHFGEYKHLNKSNFLYYGQTTEPQRMLQAGDVFVLPTYREGFGSSVIEASALGIPVICSDAYGVMDAMVENETGLRCLVGDSESLYNAMKVLADNPTLRKKLGDAGKERVEKRFDARIVTQHWVDYYHGILL